MTTLSDQVDPVAFLMDRFNYSEHEARFILSIERGTVRGDVVVPVATEGEKE